MRSMGTVGLLKASVCKPAITQCLRLLQGRPASLRETSGATRFGEQGGGGEGGGCILGGQHLAGAMARTGLQV